MGPGSELGQLTAWLGRGNTYRLSQAVFANSQDFGGQAGHVNGDISRLVSREYLATAVNQGTPSFPTGGSHYCMLANLLVFFLKSEMQIYGGYNFPT